MSGDRVWYFAYGSNLDPRTFLGRRQMKPLDTRVARLDDYALCFDLPIGPGERGVGNVRQEAGHTIWGVAYALTVEEARRLDRTEGVPQGAYRRIAVSLCDVDGMAIEAFTYESDHRRAERLPSRRYMGLLLAGARHHGLPDDWIRTLRAWPLAVDERDTQAELPLREDTGRA